MKRHVNKAIIAVVASMALLLALAASPVLGDDGKGERDYGRAKEAQEAHTDGLLAIEGVVGTAVGLNDSGEPSVKVYTEREGVRGVPKRLNGVPVEVRVTGRIVAQAAPTDTFPRPVPIGVSSGSERLVQIGGSLFCTVGTLGVRVTDGTNVYALSNNHVYAQENDGRIGDRILQPGRVDMTAQACGSPQEINDAVIGTLSDFQEIEFKRRATNVIDAAIALTSTADVGTGTPIDGYGTPSSTTVAASVGMPVQKYGRTTGLTTGTVTDINATVLVSYNSGTARFVNQVVIEGDAGAFSAGGDSGSLIVTQGGNNPVALLFAGSSVVTIGNPIDAVLARFGVTIDGEAPAPPTLTSIAVAPTAASIV
ncbi:MAG: hypothetical protein ACE5H5_03845, partial [Nitrospinota bacterium]